MESNLLVQIISWTPRTVLVSLATFLILLFTGWLWSTVAGFRSEAPRRLRIFLAFPLTNPVALIFFLRHDWRAARPALLCYLLAFAVLWGGGLAAETIEKRRLADYAAKLARVGESLAMESLIPEPVPSQSNLWLHPFLLPLAAANQRRAEEGGDRGPKPYQSMEVPKSDRRIEYPREKRERAGSGTSSGQFRELHETALTVIAAQDGEINPRNTPNTWKACGQAVLDHFRNAEESFSKLREALDRPFDRYPYVWNDAFQMLLPHLAQLKSFTRTTALRTTAGAALGRNAEAFEDIQLAIRLIHTGDSDLVISRLVQMAQTVLVLNAIRAAQQFHVWNDDQWRAIDSKLAALDFPSLAPNAMRAERIFGHKTIEPLLTMSPSRFVKEIDQLGAMEAPTDNSARTSLVRLPLDALLGGHGRANLTRNWMGCLEAYAERISGMEQAVEKTRSQAWKDCQVPPLTRGYKGYGIFATMLLPALERYFQKTVGVQAHLELARVACALERFYLAHQSYPEALPALVPEYYSRPLRDPMDHQPWRYSRIGDRGFRLYTVGENGADDGGEFEITASTSEPHKDDVSWIVQPNPPPLPQFQFNKNERSGSSPSAFKMDEALLKRYGLLPPPGSKP